MPKINVDMNSAHDAPTTFDKVKTLFEEDKDLRKMDSSYVCQFDASSFSGSAKGNKFKADMKISENGSSSRLDLVVDIPLMLSPFKSVIRETLEKKLNRILS